MHAFVEATAEAVGCGSRQLLLSFFQGMRSTNRWASELAELYISRWYERYKNETGGDEYNHQLWLSRNDVPDGFENYCFSLLMSTYKVEERNETQPIMRSEAA